MMNNQVAVNELDHNNYLPKIQCISTEALFPSHFYVNTHCLWCQIPLNSSANARMTVKNKHDRERLQFQTGSAAIVTVMGQRPSLCGYILACASQNESVYLVSDNASPINQQSVWRKSRSHGDASHSQLKAVLTQWIPCLCVSMVRLRQEIKNSHMNDKGEAEISLVSLMIWGLRLKRKSNISGKVV